MDSIAVADVVFREDLYPRIETNPATVQKYAEDLDVLPPIEVNQKNELIDGRWAKKIPEGLEVSYAWMFGSNSPKALRDMMAGTIRRGMFYPVGSVARGYFEDHQRQQQDHERRKPLPHVYFIRVENGGPVKIGVASRIGSRLDSLQTACPYQLSLIAVIPHGGYAAEAALHRLFDEHRLHGEWFEWNSTLERLLT